MNKESQRIAIAKACGWTDIKFHPASCCGTSPFDASKMDEPQIGMKVPNYCDDLNAMSEAYKAIPPSLKTKYHDTLYVICGGMSNALESSADQRAEAFLKTIGKWEEDVQAEDVSRQHGLDEDSEREKDN